MRRWPSFLLLKQGLPMALVLWSCAKPVPLPGVVEPQPGEVLSEIPGPLPNFGPFATVEDAILAACPVIMSHPHAVIPVHKTDQNFPVYWRTAREYCAWLYAPKGENVLMSLLATSSVQDNPKERHCALPEWVKDPRATRDRLSYLAILHSHMFDEILSDKDLGFLVDMAQLHGFTPILNGHEMSISIVAYFARERDGEITCMGFYRYLPARRSELVKVTRISENGGWTERVLGHLRWNTNRTYTLERERFDE